MSETALSHDQIQQLYNACSDDLVGMRNRVLLTVLFNCGLTISEASSLRFNHVDFDRGWLRAIEGLRLPRFVPLNEKAASTLKLWLQHPDSPHTFVFGPIPRSWRRRSVRSLRNDINQLSEKARVPFSSSMARVTLAKFLFDHSDEGRLIQEVIPEERRAVATLPLDNLPPFSVAYHPTEILMASKGMIPGPWEFGLPPEESDVIQEGRKLLNRVGQYL